MLETLLPILENAISKVMSEMFFLFPDVDLPLQPAPEDLPTAGCELVLSAKNDRVIRFAFSFDFPLARTMTENFMGVASHEQPDEMVNGTVKESVNMFIGNLLNEIDPEGNFSMGLPTPISVDSRLNSQPPALRFSYEGNWMKVWVREG